MFRQIFDVMLCDFKALLGEESHVLLELLALVVIEVQFLEQSLLDLPDVVVVRVSRDLASQLGGAIEVELDLDLSSTVIFRFMAEHFIVFHLFTYLFIKWYATASNVN